MDFDSDALFDGRRLRALTVVDTYTREALAIDVVQGTKREQVNADDARSGCDIRRSRALLLRCRQGVL